MSRATIERDANVARAIDAISVRSPDAKHKILSGETPLDKKSLGRLSSAPDGEIDVYAEKIVDGTYEKKRGMNAPDFGSVGSDDAGDYGYACINDKLRLDSGMSEILSLIKLEMQNIKKSGDVEGLRCALGTLIESLQKLYSKM